MPSWLQFDVSLRTRAEVQQDLNLANQGSAAYNLVRERFGLRIEPTSWLGLYIQAQDAHALGLSGTEIASDMRDTFDLRQGVIALHKDRIHLKIGRQPLRIANERLVGVSDWTNVGRTFDAIFLNYDGPVGITLFSSSVVNIYPGRIDRSSGGLHFHGAVFDIDRLIADHTIEPFVFIKTFPSTTESSTAGSVHQVTVGAYVKSDKPSGLFYEVTLAAQRGSNASQSVRTAASIVRAGYRWKNRRLHPSLAYEFDYASGNSATDPSRHGTFDQLYPSNHDAFGLTDLFGWQNIRQNRGDISISPTERLTLVLEGESLRLPSRTDAIYAASGTSLVPAPVDGFPSNALGTGLDISGKYIIGSLVANFGVGHLFPGNNLKSATRGSSQTMAYFGLTYRFRLFNPRRKSSNSGPLPAEIENDDK